MKVKQTIVHISSSLSRDVEMIHLKNMRNKTNLEKENSCNVLTLLLNKISLSSRYVCIPFFIKEIG